VPILTNNKLGGRLSSEVQLSLNIDQILLVGNLQTTIDANHSIKVYLSTIKGEDRLDGS
jgi:hypothetical protein